MRRAVVCLLCALAGTAKAAEFTRLKADE